MLVEPYQFFLNTPWGENLENQYAKSYTSFSSRFRFNGKEWEGQDLRNKPVAYFGEGASLPRGQGNYYYGARYYNPKMSVWLSVDPLAYKSPHLTPYHFVSNNPIMRVDPDGLHHFTVDSEGKIVKHETNDNFDNFYSLADYNGARKDPHMVEHINGQSIIAITIDGLTDGGSTSSFNIDDDAVADGLYKFLANNSNVEWSRIKYDYINDGFGPGNMIATSHKEGKYFAGNFIEKLNKYGGTAFFFSHSHPGNNDLNFHGPSGEHPLDFTKDGGDIGAAKDYSAMFPGLKFSIYDVMLGKEIPYTKYGSGYWSKWLKKPDAKIR